MLYRFSIKALTNVTDDNLAYSETTYNDIELGINIKIHEAA